MGCSYGMITTSYFQCCRLWSYVPGSINSHYFHKIGDGKLNPIVGVYISIIRIAY